MPRKRVLKTNRVLIDEVNMKQAIIKVFNDTYSERRAAIIYEIRKTTLQCRIKRILSKYTKESYLTHNGERADDSGNDSIDEDSPKYSIQAKVYTRCGLSEELVKLRFPRSFIGNWVCLIESESGKDTGKVTERADGTKSLGLFQVNDKQWCTYGKPGGKCGMSCDDLINENITDDAVCAEKVQTERGFQDWDGWKRNCKGRVCLIEAESGKDTSKLTVRANGSKSYGLFQINSKKACTSNKRGGLCNMKCEDFLDEDLTDDASCAKRVYNQDGFKGVVLQKTRRDLFQIWLEKKGQNIAVKRKHVMDTITSAFEDEQDRNSDWLDEDLLELPSEAIADEVVDESLPSTSSGRPSTSFSELGDRSKRRKTKKLREQYGSGELAYAAQMSLRSAGQKDAAKLIYEALLAPPNEEEEVLVTAMSQDVSDESSETMSDSDESD
ncbi:hypothetical protein RN001_000383 [Aquatica leii]|uniref:lysozyme n=1 Tax=Aquatica leii TaxID=1421715 RepID=A0AAN7PET3_9COLE|nr:hypothetical protein RN001_000383 [Aquatica leii]